jgi:hypothetical protein
VKFPFDPNQGPIYVEAEVSGPTGRSDLRLLLDPGATITLIDSDILIGVGYDPRASPDSVQVTMANGVVSVPRVVLNRLTALGQHKIGFSVLVHALPPNAGVHGLLGLDFCRGHLLILDFRAGLISLS